MSTQTQQIQAQKRAFYVRTGPENRHIMSPSELQSLFDEIAWLRNRIKNNDGVVEPRFRAEGERGSVTWPETRGD